MSYDFNLIPKIPGQDPLAAARSFVERDVEEINPGPLVPELEVKKKRLANSLIKANPKLALFEKNYSELAEMEDISEDEARTKYRDLEINGLEDGNGIQISLLDDSASVTVPYWHEPGAAAAVMDEIWKYLNVLANEGGYTIYDPQLGKILDLSKDRGAALACYGGVVTKMPGILAQATQTGQPQRATKPWWKFW